MFYFCVVPVLFSINNDILESVLLLFQIVDELQRYADLVDRGVTLCCLDWSAVVDSVVFLLFLVGPLCRLYTGT